MESFWKATAILLITAVLSVTVNKSERDISAVLTMTACCIIGAIALSYLSPILEMLWKLGELGEIRDGMLQILIRTVGIGVISELAAMICNDTGNQSLAKIMHLLGTAAILYLSIPLFESLLSVIQDLLGEI